MFKGNNNFVVGLFVSVSIAVFVGFVLWLTGRSGVEEMENYSMMFHRDVSGLSIGGPVNFMGVNIGTVTRNHSGGQRNLRQPGLPGHYRRSRNQPEQ